MHLIIHTNSMTLRTAFFLVVATFTVGCTTMQPIYATEKETLHEQISVGDTVEIARKSGGLVKFKVEEIRESGIAGDGLYIEFRDIQQVRMSRVNRKSPGGVVLVAVGTVAAILLLKVFLEKNLSPGFPAP